MDEYLIEAARLVIEKEKASIGMLQRAFRVEFSRAARIMDQLYKMGVVGEEEGTKPRRILMSKEEFEELIETAEIEDGVFEESPAESRSEIHAKEASLAEKRTEDVYRLFDITEGKWKTFPEGLYSIGNMIIPEVDEETLERIIKKFVQTISPADARMIIIDPGGYQSMLYDGLPHLFIPPLIESAKVEGLINWILSEMDYRRTLFTEHLSKNIKDYNCKCPEKPMTLIYIFVSEMELFLRTVNKDQFIELLLNCAVMGIFFIGLSKLPYKSLKIGKANALLNVTTEKELLSLFYS